MATNGRQHSGIREYSILFYVFYEYKYKKNTQFARKELGSGFFIRDSKYVQISTASHTRRLSA